jgi:hypothetical protein
MSTTTATAPAACAACDRPETEPCSCYGTDPHCPACYGEGFQIRPHCCTCQADPDECACPGAGEVHRVGGLTLAQALRRDDTAEDNGLDPDRRITCHTHQGWAADCADRDFHKFATCADRS